MATKEYNVVTRTRTARSRSARRAESATGGSVSSSVVTSSGSTSASSGSAGGHSHSNKELLDALQRDEQKYLYLREWNSEGGEDGTGEYESEKAKAGYADEAGEADNSMKWNSKEMSEMMDQPVRTSDDVEHNSVTATETLKGKTIEGDTLTVTENATVGGNATIRGDARVNGTASARKVVTLQFTTPDFRQGGLTGEGGGVYTDEAELTHAEYDYIVARRGLVLSTLTIEEINSVAGGIVASKAHGEVESIYPRTASDGSICYEVYLKDVNMFQLYDLVRFARWDYTNNQYRWCWAPVRGCNPTLRLINIWASDLSDEMSLPEVGDKLVQMGNLTDVTRQGFVYITDTGVQCFDGVSTTSLVGKCRGAFGDLSGITDNGKALSGYGVWSDTLYIGTGKTVYETFSEVVNSITKAQSDADKALTNIATANNEINAINTRLDGVVENWFEKGSADIDGYPTSQWTTDAERLNHVGDTYTNVQEYISDFETPDAGKSWRWVLSETSPADVGYHEVMVDGVQKYVYWTPIADSDAVKALLEASKAQSTADGKSRTFVTTPTPPYDEGDLWVQGGNGDILKCITAKKQGESFSASDWVKASKYTDDSALDTFKGGEYTTFVENTGTRLTANEENFESIQKQVTTVNNNITGLTESVRTNTTAIEQNKTDIALRATKVELNTAKTELQASINVNAENITSTVKTIESGGRNLLQSTNQGASGWNCYPNASSAGGAFITDDGGYTDDINGEFIKGVAFTRNDNTSTPIAIWYQLRPWLIKEGETYTLSFEIFQDNTNGNETPIIPYFTICKTNSGSAITQSGIAPNNGDTAEPGKWKRLTYTFTATGTGTSDSAQVVYFSLRATSIWSTLRIRNLQLERGNFATAWSSTESDTEEKFSEIRQTADSIELKVSEKGVANVNHAIDTDIPYLKNADFNSASANLTAKLYDVTGLKTGDMVTISFDYEWKLLTWTDAANSQVFIQMSDHYGYVGPGFKLTNQGNAINGSGHFSGTTTLGKVWNTETDATEDLVGYIYIGFRYIAQDALGSGYFKIKNLMVERGDKETTWTPRTDYLDKGLRDTGIDIVRKKVTVTADNFLVQNNAGEQTFLIDSNGKVSVSLIDADSIVARKALLTNSNGDVLVTENVVDESGYRCMHYYPVNGTHINDSGISEIIPEKYNVNGYAIGPVLSDYGYNPLDNTIERGYAVDGTVKWVRKVGNGQVTTPTSASWTELTLVPIEDLSEARVDTLPNANNPSQKYYRFNAVVSGNAYTGRVYDDYGTDAEGIPSGTAISGYFAKTGPALAVPAGSSIGATATAKKARTVYLYFEGLLQETSTVQWDADSAPIV